MILFRTLQRYKIFMNCNTYCSRNVIREKIFSMIFRYHCHIPWENVIRDIAKLGCITKISKFDCPLLGLYYTPVHVLHTWLV